MIFIIVSGDGEMSGKNKIMQHMGKLKCKN